MKNNIKLYKDLLNLFVLSILLTICLYIFTLDFPLLQLFAAIFFIVLLILLTDQISIARRRIWNKRRSLDKRATGTTFSHNIKSVFPWSKATAHPAIEDMSIGYIVPMQYGPDEFVSRNKFYGWLHKVYDIQKDMTSRRESSIAKSRWVGTGRPLSKGQYAAYEHILITTNAFDPTTSIKSRRLRYTPWDIILYADVLFDMEYR